MNYTNWDDTTLDAWLDKLDGMSRKLEITFQSHLVLCEQDRREELAEDEQDRWIGR